MLENYSRAKYVVVQDPDLVNMPSIDSETTAVALVLSTWLTRGWTAAELNATMEGTRKVKGTRMRFLKRTPPMKVVFKNPENPMQPIMKDLDRDISVDNGQFTSLAHLTASKLLSVVRTNLDSV